MGPTVYQGIICNILKKKHNGKEKKDTHDCKMHPKVENVNMQRKKET